MVRVGVVSVAAGLAGLTAIFSSCAWVVHAPATTGSRAENARAETAALRPAKFDGTFEQRFALATDESEVEANAIEEHARGERPSFEDRFAFDQSARDQSAPREPALSFEDRFGAAATLARRTTPPAASAPLITAMLTVPATPLPAAAPPAPQPRAAAAAPASAPKAAPKPAVAQAAQKPAGSYRLASLSDTPAPTTAYAPANSPIRDSGIADLLRKMARRDSATSGAAPADAAATDAAKDTSPLGDMSHTAIYDISAKTVYLPSGARLEAHSGLGEYMDDVRSVNIKSRGPTPPNVYDLTLRESMFHGVQAIRLNPVDGGLMFGRDGILAHPFMLGPNGQSNGCVSLKDYGAFLAAFQHGEFNRLVVVERLDDPPSARTAGEWLKNTLSGIFGRS